jgi:hypothetical protein
MTNPTIRSTGNQHPVYFQGHHRSVFLDALGRARRRGALVSCPSDGVPRGWMPIELAVTRRDVVPGVMVWCGDLVIHR